MGSNQQVENEVQPLKVELIFLDGKLIDIGANEQINNEQLQQVIDNLQNINLTQKQEILKEKKQENLLQQQTIIEEIVQEELQSEKNQEQNIQEEIEIKKNNIIIGEKNIQQENIQNEIEDNEIIDENQIQHQDEILINLEKQQQQKNLNQDFKQDLQQNQNQDQQQDYQQDQQKDQQQDQQFEQVQEQQLEQQVTKQQDQQLDLQQELQLEQDQTEDQQLDQKIEQNVIIQQDQKLNLLNLEQQQLQQQNQQVEVIDNTQEEQKNQINNKQDIMIAENLSTLNQQQNKTKETIKNNNIDNFDVDDILRLLNMQKNEQEKNNNEQAVNNTNNLKKKEQPIQQQKSIIKINPDLLKNIKMKKQKENEQKEEIIPEENTQNDFDTLDIENVNFASKDGKILKRFRDKNGKIVYYKVLDYSNKQKIIEEEKKPNLLKKLFSKQKSQLFDNQISHQEFKNQGQVFSQPIFYNGLCFVQVNKSQCSINESQNINEVINKYKDQINQMQDEIARLKAKQASKILGYQQIEILKDQSQDIIKPQQKKQTIFNFDDLTYRQKKTFDPKVPKFQNSIKNQNRYNIFQQFQNTEFSKPIQTTQGISKNQLNTIAYRYHDDSKYFNFNKDKFRNF